MVQLKWEIGKANNIRVLNIKSYILSKRKRLPHVSQSRRFLYHIFFKYYLVHAKKLQKSPVVDSHKNSFFSSAASDNITQSANITFSEDCNNLLGRLDFRTFLKQVGGRKINKPVLYHLSFPFFRHLLDTMTK